ncbi:MAG: hypothetical protein WCT04_03680 [Planctomycetota bacterium]
MSFVAKVFVVLNFFMSAVFLYFATTMWAANTKWQKMYEAEKSGNVIEVAKAQKLQKDASLKILGAEKNELAMRSERDREKGEKESEREKNLKLIAEVTSAHNARDLADGERKEEARENKRLVEDNSKMHNIVTKLSQAVNVERANAQAIKNEKADMEAELNSTKALLSTANRELKVAQNDVAKASNQIENLIRKGVNVPQILGENPDQPAINGKVLAVRADVGLVMLSVGSTNNVKVGYQFTVSVGGVYKGIVQVVNVFPDMCSAKLMPGTQNTTGAQIETNDEAMTHL